MNFNIENITVKNPNVRYRLIRFLENISNYDNFDENMEMDVFVNSFGDFTAVEAVDYRLQFTSSDHKLLETIQSKYNKTRTNYREFSKIVYNLS